MKEFFISLVVVAIGFSILNWDYNHCVKDISFETVVEWKEVDGRYYAELENGTLERVPYKVYYEHELQTFIYDVKFCDGKMKYQRVNDWLTFH